MGDLIRHSNRWSSKFAEEKLFSQFVIFFSNAKIGMKSFQLYPATYGTYVAIFLSMVCGTLITCFLG